MAFKKWLKREIGSKTPQLGPEERDFAEDVISDKSFREPPTLTALIVYLQKRRACEEALAAGRRCFQMWLEQDPHARIDGLSPGDIEKVRKATRQVWSWSHPKKLCVARATDAKGFGRCEKCKRRVPKVYVDHITPVGKVDAGYIERLFCPSSKLQALCKECHGKKTRGEAKERARPKRKKLNFCDTF